MIIKLKMIIREAVAFAAALLITAHGSVFCQNRISEGENYHNTSFVETASDEVKNRLFQFNEDLKNNNSAAAASQLLWAIKLGGDSIIPFGQRTFLSVRGTALRRIANMTEASRNIYMERAESEAKKLLQMGTNPPDAVVLNEIVSCYPLTAQCFEALYLLGWMAFERGEYLLSAYNYSRFIIEAEYLTDTALTADPNRLLQIRASLYISMRMAGRYDEAEAIKPKTGLVLEGIKSESIDFESMLENADVEKKEPEAGWPTRGGHRTRFHVPPFDCNKLEYLWNYTFNKSPDRGLKGPLDPTTLRLLKAKPRQAVVYPIVYNDKVYIFDDLALYPLDLATGKLLFGPIRWDWSLLFGEKSPRLESVTYSGAVSQGVLYAVINQRSTGFNPSSDHLGMLFALDLDKEGYGLWRRGGESEEDTRLHGVAFTGAPAIVGNRVFILGTRYLSAGNKKAEARLFCFDAANGDLLYHTFLCSGAEVDLFEIRIGSESRRTKPHVELGSPVAEQAGVVYCLTNLGVVGAVNAFTGKIEWLFKYNRIRSQNPDQYYRDYCLDTGGWKDSLPIVTSDRIYSAPEDSRFFYCLDMKPSRDGFIILDDPIEKGRMISLVGFMDHTFYFSAREGGKNYIAAKDQNGATIWETLPFEAEDRISGRPLLTSSAVFVPTEKYLYRIDLKKKGLITDNFPLPADLGGNRSGVVRYGNIIAINQYLVSVSREDVIVFKGIIE